MHESKSSPSLSAAPGGAAEGEVINQNVYGAVRTLADAGGPKKAIIRQLGLDVKTVRKWLRRSWAPERRRARGRLLDRWREFLQARAPEVGFNGLVLTREMTAQENRGGYWAVLKYIAPWRKDWRGDGLPTVRFETRPGEQAQVDWGSTALYLGDVRTRVHMFTMVLGFSRRIFARAYRSEGLDPLLDGHAAAFAHFSGRTETILYDNPRTIVTRKDEAAGHVVVSLLDWCVNVADQRVHGTTHEKPQERFLRAETLIPVDLRPPAPRERVVIRRVPTDCYVAVETNRYPVPFT